MSRILLGGLCGIFFALSGVCFGQSLINTIWEAEVEIGNLNLQSVKEGVLQKGPILKNGTTILPLEIWFWNGSRCGLVFPTKKWNFRDEYSWGTRGDPNGFYYTLGPKYWGGGGLAPSDENEKRKVLVTDGYTYNAAKRSGTFTQKTLYLFETSTRKMGSYWQVNGNFSINGNRLTVHSATYTLQPNPSGLNAYRIISSPRLKSGTTFVKTLRQPSLEKNVLASFKSFSESSWDNPPGVTANPF